MSDEHAKKWAARYGKIIELLRKKKVDMDLSTEDLTNCILGPEKKNEITVFSMDPDREDHNKFVTVYLRVPPPAYNKHILPLVQEGMFTGMVEIDLGSRGKITGDAVTRTRGSTDVLIVELRIQLEERDFVSDKPKALVNLLLKAARSPLK